MRIRSCLALALCLGISLGLGIPVSAEQAVGIPSAPKIEITKRSRTGWFPWPAHQVAAASPWHDKEGTFKFEWVEVTGGVGAAVAAKINVELRRLGGETLVASVRPGVPKKEGDNPPDDFIECKVVQAGPDVLTVVFGRDTRGAIDEKGHTCRTTVRHFDLKTGEQLGLKDFVQPGVEAYRVIAAAMRASEDAQENQFLLLEFTGPTDATPVYFANGKLVVCAREIHMSYAGDAFSECAVPVEEIRSVLSERGRAMAQAAGWKGK